MKEREIDQMRQRLQTLGPPPRRSRRRSARKAGQDKNSRAPRFPSAPSPLRVVSHRDFESEDVLGAAIPAAAYELYDFATSLADNFETITPHEAERRNRVLAEMHSPKRWMVLTRDRILYGLERACAEARKFFPEGVYP